MNTSDSNDLSAKLRTWSIEPKLADSFSRQVWQRIAVRQAVREEVFWLRIIRWLSTQLVRPRYAMVLAAFSLLASIGVAHLQAQGTKAKHWKELEVRYAVSVDPLAIPR